MILSWLLIWDLIFYRLIRYLYRLRAWRVQHVNTVLCCYRPKCCVTEFPPRQPQQDEGGGRGNLHRPAHGCSHHRHLARPSCWRQTLESLSSLHGLTFPLPMLFSLLAQKTFILSVSWIWSYQLPIYFWDNMRFDFLYLHSYSGYSLNMKLPMYFWDYMHFDFFDFHSCNG